MTIYSGHPSRSHRQVSATTTPERSGNVICFATAKRNRKHAVRLPRVMPKIRAVPRVYLGVAAWHGAALAMAYFHQALWNYGKLPWLVAWIVYVLAAGLSFEHLTWRAAFWVWAPVFFIIVFAFFVPALIAPAITFALVLLARFGLARFA